MNRAFPPETIRACDVCGCDLTLIVLDGGGLEANNVADYVDADPGTDPADHVIVCQSCKTAVGIGEPE
jgi:hypothetical protein